MGGLSRNGLGMLDQCVEIGENAQRPAVAVKDVSCTSGPLDRVLGSRHQPRISRCCNQERFCSRSLILGSQSERRARNRRGLLTLSATGAGAVRDRAAFTKSSLCCVNGSTGGYETRWFPLAPGFADIK